MQLNGKRILCAALVAGAACVGLPGPAGAETSVQEFRIINMNGEPGTVVGTGSVIYGVGVEQNTRPHVPPGSPFDVTLTFPDGQLFQRVTPGPAEIDFNPTSCVTRVVLHPTTVLTGGTGAYAGATGAGSATARRTIVGARDDSGDCLPPPATPILELSIVQSSTTLILP